MRIELEILFNNNSVDLAVLKQQELYRTTLPTREYGEYYRMNPPYVEKAVFFNKNLKYISPIHGSHNPIIEGVNALLDKESKFILFRGIVGSGKSATMREVMRLSKPLNFDFFVLRNIDKVVESGISALDNLPKKGTSIPIFVLEDITRIPANVLTRIIHLTLKYERAKLMMDYRSGYSLDFIRQKLSDTIVEEWMILQINIPAGNSNIFISKLLEQCNISDDGIAEILNQLQGSNLDKTPLNSLMFAYLANKGVSIDTVDDPIKQVIRTIFEDVSTVAQYFVSESVNPSSPINSVFFKELLLISSIVNNVPTTYYKSFAPPAQIEEAVDFINNSVAFMNKEVEVASTSVVYTVNSLPDYILAKMLAYCLPSSSSYQLIGLSRSTIDLVWKVVKSMAKFELFASRVAVSLINLLELEMNDESIEFLRYLIVIAKDEKMYFNKIGEITFFWHIPARNKGNPPIITNSELFEYLNSLPSEILEISLKDISSLMLSSFQENSIDESLKVKFTKFLLKLPFKDQIFILHKLGEYRLEFTKIILNEISSDLETYYTIETSEQIDPELLVSYSEMLVAVEPLLAINKFQPLRNLYSYLIQEFQNPQSNIPKNILRYYIQRITFILDRFKFYVKSPTGEADLKLIVDIDLDLQALTYTIQGSDPESIKNPRLIIECPGDSDIFAYTPDIDKNLGCHPDCPVHTNPNGSQYLNEFGNLMKFTVNTKEEIMWQSSLTPWPPSIDSFFFLQTLRDTGYFNTEIKSFADIGCGSGILGVVLTSQNFSVKEAYYTDVEMSAVNLTRWNMEHLKRSIANRDITHFGVVQYGINALSNIQLIDKRLDLIISLPPYLPSVSKERPLSSPSFSTGLIEDLLFNFASYSDTLVMGISSLAKKDFDTAVNQYNLHNSKQLVLTKISRTFYCPLRVPAVNQSYLEYLVENHGLIDLKKEREITIADNRGFRYWHELLIYRIRLV